MPHIPAAEPKRDSRPLFERGHLLLLSAPLQRMINGFYG